MNRIKIVMAAAIVFATASAFTTQTVSMEDYFVEISPGIILPLSEAQEFGNCKTQNDSNCRLTKDANNQYHPTNDNAVWEEL